MAGQARGERTRRRILDGARALYVRQGPDRVSLHKIAESAGVTYGLIHYHFGSENELWSAVMDDLAAEFQSAFASAQSPSDMLAVALGNPDLIRMVAFQSLTGELPQRSKFPIVEGTIAFVSTWEPDPVRARILAATVLAAAAGWAVFSTFFSAAARLDEVDSDQVLLEVAAGLARLVQFPPHGPAPDSR